jgi:hypothetical protein
MAGASSSGGQDGGMPPSRAAGDLGWEHTVTTGVTPGGGAVAGGAAGGIVSAAGAQQVVRHGPGVPGAAAREAAPTAEQVWQAGPPDGPPRGQRARLIAGSALSVALLIASVVVIFLRLHHGPFGVTGVTVTGPARSGCTVTVTGRIATTGADCCAAKIHW